MLDLYSLVRPALFCLEPEHAHTVAMASLKMAQSLGLYSRTYHDPVNVMGLSFPNRIGLAAGFDKDAQHIDALAKLGFGFIEVGTVTPRPQPGNPKPRLFRLPGARALINRMGFNNGGVESLVKNVRASRYSGILGINLGKNADTPLERAIDDYLFSLRAVYEYASYVTINVSSPNTPGLRDLQHIESLDQMLAPIKEVQSQLSDQHQVYKPIVVKVAPDLSDDQIRDIAQCLRKHAIDGLIATNTSIDHSSVEGQAHSDERGGLSGAPIFEQSCHVVKQFHEALNGDLPIIAVGGISTRQQAQQMIDNGASLIQLYTGFIYQGPNVVRDCQLSDVREGDA